MSLLVIKVNRFLNHRSGSLVGHVWSRGSVVCTHGLHPQEPVPTANFLLRALPDPDVVMELEWGGAWNGDREAFRWLV